MEKAWGDWYRNLWANDENTISSKKTHRQNRISEGKIARIRRKGKRAKISSRDLEKTAFNLRRKDDTRLWGKSTAKTKTDWSYEIINRKPWGDNELTNDIVLKA